ncbi:MAG: hypothetical protein L3J63_03240 [Geopsychrobacter sp.]|nr:hypothetical protein [Geopsychrobacter sp.]
MKYLLPLLLLVVLGLSVQQSAAAEINTAFALIKCPDQKLLKTFNQKVRSRGYGFGFGHKKSGNPQETARRQVNQLIGRIQEILDMRPKNLHFTIQILSSPQEVQATFFKEYNRKVDYIAFYSPRSETVYLSTKKLRRTVLAHEMAHAVIDRYFGKAPPVKIHELLAQYVEKQL